MKYLIALPAFALLCAAPAFAQVAGSSPEAPQDDAGAVFKSLDANADSTLSLAEVQRADSSVQKSDFDRYDADKSSALSLTEFEQWHSDMSAAHDDKSHN